MDVAAWLHGLGLGEYEATFHKNAVDGEVLPELTADDLKEMGVAAVGHRRKLLAAIATLRSGAPQPARVVATEAASLTALPTGSTGAERRQLTVLFCDLAGSTALSSRLDPEDLREVISAYHHAVAEAVRRQGGYVAKFLGDGVLAYFGWPEAHEDDAERAVRAGIAAAEATAGLKPAAELLAARVGIATGPVVVGEVLGEGEVRERSVVGETPNLAARLQALADPGAVVLDNSTWRLTGTLFEYADLGEVQLGGVPRPVRAWRAVRESKVESRFEALRSGSAPPALIGREDELEGLLRRWRRAVSGEGQAVLLSGEAGIGKSRLAAALRGELSCEPHDELVWFCAPQHANTALHPLGAWLERAAGFTRGEEGELRLAKLEALLAPIAPTAEEIALIADFLSLQAPAGGPDLSGLTAQRRRERTLEALVRQVEALAHRRPLFVLLEDVHWADPSTRDLLDLILRRIGGLTVLLVLTHRPEFRAPWSGQPGVTELRLSRLGRRDSAALVTQVSGGKKIPAVVLEEIVGRTDGVPLFAEELTKTVLASGLLRTTEDQYVLDGPVGCLGIPATLRASLTERLDRLASVKDVAQTASVIGREFTYEVLASVTGLTGGALAGALDQLVGADLITQTGVPPEAKYVFRHALIQDAACASLLRPRRQHLHARIAAALRELYPDMTETGPEVLAHHYTEAGLVEEALAAWEAAGMRALARSAQHEATAHLRQAADLVRQLPTAEKTRRHELRILLALGQELFGVRGPVDETIGVFDRAFELARLGNEENTMCQAIYGMFTQLALAGQLTRVVTLGTELEQFAERQGSAVARICSSRMLGTALYLGGDLAGAERRVRDAIRTQRDTGAIAPASTAYAHHPGLTSPATLSHILWARGFPDQAVAASREAIEGCRPFSEANSLAYCLQWALSLRLLLRDHEGGLAVAAEQISLGKERGSNFWMRVGSWGKGAALILAGEVAEGLALLKPNLREFCANGGLQLAPLGFCYEALGHLERSELEECERSIEQARDIMDRTRQIFFEPDICRLAGMLHLRHARHLEAEAAFRQGIHAARAQGAGAWELRLSCELARFWRDQGREDNARALLVPVYTLFSEGFAFRDLVEARSLLEELGTAPAAAGEHAAGRAHPSASLDPSAAR